MMDDPEKINSIPTSDVPSDTPDEKKIKPRRTASRFERYIRQVISGSFLANADVQRHYPYVLFMSVLMFLYIANGFHVQKLHRQHNRLNNQVKELRARSLTLSSQRMIATRQSEILQKLEQRGIPLEELLSPPKVIE